jgi:hypothetical protein
MSRKPLKAGLLIVATAWFLLVFHELVKATYAINEYEFFQFEPVRTWILVTDYLGFLAILLRATAAIVAVGAIMFYFFKKKDASSPNARKLLKYVLIAEALYWVFSFLPSAIWAFTPSGMGAGGDSFLGLSVSFMINTGIPCLVEAVAIPAVLLKLVFELNPAKPAKNAIKWALIAGTTYIFVLWLNNTSNWLNVALQQTRYAIGLDGALYPTAGFEYVTRYPDHIISFAFTTVGLLALALYAAYFTKKSAGTESWRNLDLKKIGVVVTFVGLYFLLIYVMWIVVGTNMQLVQGTQNAVDVKWSDWYAWFLGHNLDLWVLSLPLVGVPLLFHQKAPKTQQG